MQNIRDTRERLDLYRFHPLHASESLLTCFLLLLFTFYICPSFPYNIPLISPLLSTFQSDACLIGWRMIYSIRKPFLLLSLASPPPVLVQAQVGPACLAPLKIVVSLPCKGKAAKCTNDFVYGVI